ncbi:hypothetical protein Acor_82890 [Acrocarpospora corrugata]|uniref:Uncharacterized protein n=1 Tax=Acrocarpospora corrugata TaxID=35763 RepID=A0A5M3WD74_9ACTN|nr:hypothetical protein [Acrocarpospora corrugata]GES06220.1 hypothetical protein Acor_82890 [Acrocarpospora corrugata]
MNAGRRPIGEPPPAGRLGQRTRYALLVTVVICVAVAVPPLLIPRQDDRAEASGGQGMRPPATAPALARTPMAGGGESTPRPTGEGSESTPQPTDESAPRPTATPGRPRVPSCAAPRGSEITAVPACLIYASALGTGWRVSGSGTNVTPGRPVPDSDQVAVRIQKRVKSRDQPATVTLLASSAVAIGAGSRLRLRVYGGRQYGTILRLSASPSAGRAGATTVTLQAPPERWASFVVRVGDLSPARLRRIDLAIATDQLPQSYEFYLDDLALGK